MVGLLVELAEIDIRLTEGSGSRLPAPVRSF
jgi:hypothetical protein